MKRPLAVLGAVAVVLALLACAGAPGVGKKAADGEPGKQTGAAGGEADGASAAAPAAEEPKEAAKAAGSSADGVRGSEIPGGGPSTTLWSEGKTPAMPPAVAAAAAPALAGARVATPTASGLKAGFADDNKQFNYFVRFLAEYGPQAQYLPIPVEERIVLRVRDREGRSLPSAGVMVRGEGGRLLCRGSTHADGTFLFFPAEHLAAGPYEVTATYNQTERRVSFDRNGPREVVVAFEGSRGELQAVPLDLLFILDTTGSMDEEIARLKTTIELINLNLSSLSSTPRLRFGLVLYRDRGDEYVTQVVPFTPDLAAFQAALDQVEASGGGDTPEDLQAALQEAMRLDWSRGGVRLAFVITDAPPHLDYGQSYTYVQAAREAREKGVKIFSVGTGGLDLQGEIVLRQVSQYTSAKYIFLTYGESGESEGGAAGSVSHHTGANYQTDKLEAIIIRFAKEELAHLSGQPLEEGEEYFAAQKLSGEEAERTLGKLFSMAVSQLIDYCSVSIAPATAAAVVPLSPAEQALAANAEYFTEQLELAFAQDAGIRQSFRLVERKDLQAALSEIELRLTDLFEGSAGSVRVGQMLGAEVLLLGKLYRKEGGYELFLKLLRVQTGEILSVTKARIDRRLGLEG